MKRSAGERRIAGSFSLKRLGGPLFDRGQARGQKKWEGCKRSTEQRLFDALIRIETT